MNKKDWERNQTTLEGTATILKVDLKREKPQKMSYHKCWKS